MGHGNQLATLLPTHAATWWPVVEDIFSSDAFVALRESLVEGAVRQGECACLSIDGTFKVCLPLLGQARFNEPADVRAAAPFQARSA